MDSKRTTSPRSSYRNPPLRVGVRDVQMRPAQPASSLFVPRHVPVSIPSKSSGAPTVTPDPVPLPEPAMARSDLAPSQTPASLPEQSVRPVKRSIHHRLRIRKKKPPAEQVPNDKVSRRRDSRILYAIATVVLIVGGVLAYRAYSLNQEVATQVDKLQSTASSETGSSSLPVDTKPADKNYLQNYQVAATLPRLLTIKKIGVTARVLQVGVDKDNRMGVPTTAYDVAWYNGSSRPGEMGAMVIDGHVQGVGGGAIFTNLKKLAAGDIMTLERGDGKILTYAVAKTETVSVDKLDVGSLLASVDTSRPGLNLITCAGAYDTKSDSFDSRTVVYTVQQ